MTRIDDARVERILNRRPAVGLAVGVVRGGSLEFFHGHGMADIADDRPVTPSTVFRIASITKTFTAIAVMQLWERGLVDLDAPANEYLRAFRLLPAKASFRPATVRHLMTHTAGIGEVAHPSGLLRRLFGETVPVGDKVPTPGEFYRGGLRIAAEPGTRFTYSDHGFVALGQIVEDVTGQPLERYLREHIFHPLGMAHTDLFRSDRVAAHLATGYEVGSHGPKAVADYEVITAAGGGGYSSVADMGRYLAALLGGGSNEHGSVLKPATLATMFEPQYRPDPRVSGIGLAFWRGSVGGHRVVEHGGIAPGFNSEILIAPDDGVAVMAFTNGARGAMLWLPAEVTGLLGDELDVTEPGVRTDIPQHPDVWRELCGWYSVPARLTDARAREMVGAGVEVFVRGGRLMLRGLSPVPAIYHGLELHPDDDHDPYVFRLDFSRYGMGSGRVVFSQEPGLGTTAIHFDLLPLTARKQPAATNPRLWVAGTLGVATAAVAFGRRRARRRRLSTMH